MTAEIRRFYATSGGSTDGTARVSFHGVLGVTIGLDPIRRCPEIFLPDDTSSIDLLFCRWRFQFSAAFHC